MTLEDGASAQRSAFAAEWSRQRVKRLLLGAVLVYLLWLLVNSLISFGYQVKRQQDTVRTQEQDWARQTAMIRQGLEQQRAALAKPPLVTRSSANKSTRQKLTAPALVTRLRQQNAFGLVANSGRRLHCSENHGNWDYTCLFHPDPITTTTWVQFGVLVDDAHVIEMSKLYPSSTSLPAPLSVGTK